VLPAAGRTLQRDLGLGIRLGLRMKREGQGFVGTGIDVTEQEQLTKAVRKSEEELRQILDLTPQLIGVFGPHRERLYVNRIALDYLGVTLDEWLDSRPGAEILDRLNASVDTDGKEHPQWTAKVYRYAESCV
jgi:PAS domain-containing protein